MESPSVPVASAPGRRPRVWTVLVAFVVLFGLLVIGSVSVTHIATSIEAAKAGVDLRDGVAQAALAEKVEALPWPTVAVVMMVGTVALSLALLGGRLSPQPLRERLRLNAGVPLPAWAWLTAAVGCFAVGQCLESLAVLTGAWSWTGSLKGFQAASQGPLGTFALLLFFGSPVAGTAEELFFRGYVQTRLVERWGPKAGVVGAATLFGLLHLDPIHGPITLVVALFLGWLAVHTGSVRLPIFVHILNNGTSFLLGRYAPPSSEYPASVHTALLCVSTLLVVGAVVLLRRIPEAPKPAAPAVLAGA
ncbi:CPBP family intramembrane glutamic endopeptidase [Corallococcus exercitus]|uniref:CPBP family intramembrane metalloprotease n=1 Tax=Corallococcus exercitus TaxID=2316736 RepID=A0A7Y4NGH1_9BACT|nr:CPBP family intramembrane glutamic endopeptidase [Corallococcus exercitus]NOK13392.1 CPBP family intramembrane metalloprotease [Corallococcus exercitus]